MLLRKSVDGVERIVKMGGMLCLSIDQRNVSMVEVSLQCRLDTFECDGIENGLFLTGIVGSYILGSSQRSTSNLSIRSHSDTKKIMDI